MAHDSTGRLNDLKVLNGLIPMMNGAQRLNDWNWPQYLWRAAVERLERLEQLEPAAS